MIVSKSNTAGNTSLLEKIIGRLKKPFYQKVFGLTNGFTQLDKRCLLYMKTTPLYRKSNQHTNMWETRQFIYILNSLGFLVDMVGTEENDYIPRDEYDLFIGYGSGNSGKHFNKYAKALKKAKKVIYACGPEPSLSNRLVRERYDNFNERTGLAAPYMRTSDVDFEEFAAVANYIFCIGERNAFSAKSYEKYNLPIFPINPSTNGPDPSVLNKQLKDQKHFLCFAGNGLICKGIDVVIEAFKSLPDLHLHICGPKEDAVYEAYADLFLDNSCNINFYGFVDIQGAKYAELIDKCCFTILHSAAEACCTAICNNMKSGLVPVVNYEVGIDVTDFGFWIETGHDRVNAVKRAAIAASSISPEDYFSRVDKTIQASQAYTRESFTNTLTRALEEVIT